MAQTDAERARRYRARVKALRAAVAAVTHHDTIAADSHSPNPNANVTHHAQAVTLGDKILEELEAVPQPRIRNLVYAALDGNPATLKLLAQIAGLSLSPRPSRQDGKGAIFVFRLYPEDGGDDLIATDNRDTDPSVPPAG